MKNHPQLEAIGKLEQSISKTIVFQFCKFRHVNVNITHKNLIVIA